MKILFVYFEVEKYSRTFYQGIGSIASWVQREGHDVELLWLYGFERNKIHEMMETYMPDIVGVSSTIRTIPLARRVISEIHSIDKNCFIVIGGVHPTIAPETLVNIKGLNGICIGEGEEALTELANRLENKQDYSDVRNFWFIDNHNVYKTPIRQLIYDLDKLPFSNREIFRYEEVIDSSRKKKATFMATRGCNHDCSYCANHAIKKTYADEKKYFRARSPENVIEEIESVISRYPQISFITFQDDTLVFNKQWLKDLTTLYKSRVGLPFCCNARVDEIDEEAVDILRYANCVEVRMGIEAGNDYIRNFVLKKNISKQQIVNAFHLVNASGMKTVSLNMIGLPYEDVNMIRETIELNKICESKSVRCTIFEPRAGTEIYDLVKKEGWLSYRKFTNYNNSMLIGKEDARSNIYEDINEDFEIPCVVNARICESELSTLHKEFLEIFNNK